MKQQEADALFGGPKIPDNYHGKRVSGNLPDKNAAKRLAKSKGADSVIVGLCITKSNPGFKPYYSPCWLCYSGGAYLGAITQDYVGLGGGPSPIRFTNVSESDTVKLGKSVKAAYRNRRATMDRATAIAHTHGALKKIHKAKLAKAAKMTKQHFIMLAKAISKLSNDKEKEMMVSALEPMLVASNPNFDMGRFRAACGLA